MENLNKSDGKKNHQKLNKHWRESEIALVLGGLDFERYREGWQPWLQLFGTHPVSPMSVPSDMCWWMVQRQPGGRHDDMTNGSTCSIWFKWKQFYDLPPCSHSCDSVSVLSVDKDPLFCIETRSLSHVACENLRQRTWLSPLSPLNPLPFSYLIAGHRACSQQVLKRTVRPLEASQLRKIRSKMLNHAVDKGANKQPLSRDES